MALAKICPNCQGCGRTSKDAYGLDVPQPTFTAGDSTAQGWTKCKSCDGVGVVAAVDGQRFANGLSVNDYLQIRLGDM